MFTQGDGFPIHQTAEPIAYAGTDRNFCDRYLFNGYAKADGEVWNTRAAIAPDGGKPADFVETVDAHMETSLRAGTRHATSGMLTIRPKDGPALRIGFEPIVRFQMAGIGYLNQQWNHGGYRGELVVARDVYRLDAVDVTSPTFFHIQALSRVTLEQDGQPGEQGLGVFEQLIIGPYAPLGIGDADDPGAFARKADIAG